jgi:hypothetical protein
LLISLLTFDFVNDLSKYELKRFPDNSTND